MKNSIDSSKHFRKLWGRHSILNMFTIMAMLINVLFGIIPGPGVETVSADSQNFAAGSLIIPMDTDISGNHGTYNQNLGMWKAYGLVNRLLLNGIPVRWSINILKEYSGVDFSISSVKDLRTGTGLSSWDYRGGPFIIDSSDAAAAKPIITAWWASYGNQPNVHEAQANFSAPIDITLRSAPRIANEATNAGIAIAYYNAAGIPDLNGNTWTSTSPNILDQTKIANGGLFQQGACSERKFDIFVTPHNSGYSYSLLDPNNSGTKTYAQLDYFVNQGGGWTALCHSILSNENAIADLTRNGSAAVKSLFATSLPGGVPGGFLTTTGFTTISNTAGTWTVDPTAVKLPVIQAVTTTATQTLPGGSVQTWPGLGMTGAPTYYSYTERVAYFKGTGSISHDNIIAGTYHNGTGLGKLTYIGGHSYSTAVPYSNNFEAPYLRAFYNSLFFNGSAVAQMDLQYSPKTFPQNGSQPLTVSLVNTGGSVATNVNNVSVTLSSGFTYLGTISGPQPSVSGQTLNWGSIGDVAGGQTPITFQVEVGPSVKNNVGTYQFGKFQANYGDIFGEGFSANLCRSITISPVPAPSLIKSPSTQGPFLPGSPVKWTLIYQNTGSAEMVNTILEDVLPPGFRYVSGSPSPMVIPGEPTIVRWTIGTLAPGQSGSVTVTALAGPITAGSGDPPAQTFTNIATLTGQDAGGTSYSASAEATVELQGLAIALTKTVDKALLTNLPDTLTYTLRPSYSGIGLLENVRVIDPIPTGVTYLSAGQGGTYGAYVPIAAVNGVESDGTNPESTVSLSTSLTTLQFGGSVIVTMLVKPTGSGLTNVVPDSLTSDNGDISCGPPSPLSLGSIASGGTGTFTYTCTLPSPGELTFLGSFTAAGDYEGGIAESNSVLVTNNGATNFVTWNLGSNDQGAGGFKLNSGTPPGIYAFRGDGKNNFWRYEIIGNTWGNKANALGNVKEGGSLAYDGGGYQDGYIYALRGAGTNAFWRYDIDANSWLARANTPDNVKSGGALVWLNGYVYALQGDDKTGFWRYNPATNTWTCANGTASPSVANCGTTYTPSQVKEGGALTTDGTYIYALQGNKGSSAFWRFNPGTNTWDTRAEPPADVKWGGALTRIGNFIYAFRGDGKRDFWRYDISANTWTARQLAPANVKEGGALTTDGTFVYALRGAGQKNFWRYNPGSNTWQALALTLENVRQGGALAFVPGLNPITEETSLAVSPLLVIGGDTITVTLVLSATDGKDNVSPGSLTVVSLAGSATATCSGPSSSPVSIPAGGSTTVTYTCTAVAGANAGGKVRFTVSPSGDMPGATSDSVLVTPPLTFQVTAPNGAPSQIVNSAIMGASGQSTLSNPVTTNTGSPQLSIVKSNLPLFDLILNPGDLITYTMYVQNIGSGTAANVTISDIVPANTTYSTCSGGTSCSLTGSTVTWNVGTLASGQSATVSMVVSANTNVPISDTPITIPNTASVVSTETTTPVTSNEVTNQLQVKPKIIKSVTPQEAATGDTLTYTLVVSNPGAPFTGTLSDVVPTGTVFAGPQTCTSISCTYDSETDTVAWAGVTFPSGDSTFTFDVTVTASGGTVVVNSATIDPTEPNIQPILSNEVETPIGPELAIVKFNDPQGEVSAEDEITYTLNIVNESEVTATNVLVTDSVPTGTDYVVDSCSGPINTTCSLESDTVTWILGNIPGGETFIVSFKVKVKDPVPTNLLKVDNAAQAAAENAPTPAESNLVTNPIAGSNLLQLLLEKSADKQIYTAVEQTINYSFKLTNIGNVPLYAPFVVIDPMFTIINCPPETSMLAPAGAITCTATYPILPGDIAAKSVTNTATATAQDAESGGNTVTSNTAEATVKYAGLMVEKSADPQTYSKVGDEITYTYLVTNTGSVALTNVTVTDPMTGLSELTCNPTQPAELAPGGTMTCTAIYEIVPGDLTTGTVQNTATATGKYQETTVTDTDEETVTVQVADLSLTKTVDYATPSVGDTIKFTITVTNAGPDAASNVVVKDQLPSGLTYVSSAPSQGTYDEVTGLWSVGTLDNQGSATLEIVVTVSSATNTSNYAQVNASDQYDPNSTPGNDSTTEDDDDTSTVTVQVLTDLSISKTNVVNSTLFYGETFTWTIEVTNSGNTASFAQGYLTIIRDVLPAGATYGNVGGTYSSIPGLICEIAGTTADVLRCRAGAGGVTLPAGTSFTVTVDVTPTLPGVLNNTAYVDFQNSITESNEDNNSDSDSVTVLIVLLPGLTLDKTAAPESYSGVGETILYSYNLTNSGAVPLYAPFTVSDDRVSVSCPAEPTSLLPGESITCSAFHTITQADLDAGKVVNTATASAKDLTGGDVTSNQDSEEVSSIQRPSLLIVKKANETSFALVDDVIDYKYFVINDGNVTLTGPFIVEDDKAEDEFCPDVDSIAPGSFIICEATYTITQPDLDAGYVTNVAFATGYFGDTPIATEPDNETINATGAVNPSLRIVKSAAETSFDEVDDVLNYTFFVINDGNVTLTGPFTVIDDKALDETCPVTETLAPGAFITCTGTYIVRQADLDVGYVTNVAFARGFYDGKDVNSDTDTVTVNADAAANPSLVLVKRANENTYAAEGDVLTYSYLLINTGNVTLTGPFSINDDKTSDESCPPEPSSLPPGGTITCTASYTVSQADVEDGSVKNIATGQGFYNDTPVVSDPDSETVSVSITPNPSLMIVKSVAQSYYDEVGDVLDYTYLVINTGNVTLSGPFKVTDNKIENVSCPDAGSLDLGGYLTCTAAYTVTLDDLSAGSVTNTAFSSGYYKDQAVNSGTDDATAPARDAADPSLLIIKKADQPVYSNAGDVITYTYLLINNGNVPLAGPFTVNDNKASDEYCPNVGSLEPGASLTCTASYTITSADVEARSVTNIASASGTYNGQTVNSGTDDATVNYCNCDLPGLIVVKTAVQSTYAAPGEVIVYNYLVINSGNVPLDAPITVWDDKIGKITCLDTGSLAAGATLPCTGSYTIRAEDMDPGSVTNTATANGQYQNKDVSSEPDSETVSINPNPLPSLLIVKSAVETGYMAAGDTLHYNYLVVNNGNVILDGPIMVADNRIEGPITCLESSTLAPGAFITCSATYTVTDQDLIDGSVSNEASASASFKNALVTSNKDSETVNASIDPEEELLIIKTASQPTYSQENEEITYTFLVINTGNVNLDGPFSVVDDRIPGANINCESRDTLKPGEMLTCTAKYQISKPDIEAPSVTNTAYATNGKVESAPTAETIINTIVPQPSLLIIKTAREASFNAVGDTLNFTYFLVNTGNVPLSGPFTVDDNKITGVVCDNPGSLEPSAFLTCSAVYTVGQPDLDAGFVTNLAKARGYYGDSPVDSGTASVTIPAGDAASPSLRIIKNATEKSFSAVGDVLNYSYYLINDGNVTLNGPFSVSDDKTTVTCLDTGSLAPGSIMVCEASYIVQETDLAAGFVTNTAYGTGTFNGGTITSPDDSETVMGEIVANPSLLVVKSVSESSFNAVGDVLSYSYLVINTGNVTLDGPFTVDDDRTSVTCPDTASLNPGGFITCTAVYTVDQDDLTAGFVTNTAIVRAFFNGVEISSSPDSETVSAGAEANPSLLVVKSVREGYFSALDEVLHYSYLVINTGNVTLDGPFTIEDDRTTDEECPAVASLDPGQFMTCTSTHTVTQDDLNTGSIANIATAQGFLGETPIVSAPDTETVLKVVLFESLMVTKLVTSSGPYELGDTITFSITAVNTGTATLTGVTISDPGMGVILGMCSPSIPTTLTVGQSVTCQASYVVTEADITAGSYSNTASADSDQTDPTTDTEVVIIGQAAAPAITVVKEVSVDGGTTWQDANTTPGPNLAGGTDPLFRFTVTNTGNVTLSGITLSDTDITTFYQSNLSAICTIPATLAADTSFTCYGKLTWAAGQHANTATATGIFNTIVYSDSDLAHYYGVTSQFIPPIGTKTVDSSNLPQLTWRMVWINNQNSSPILTYISDTLDVGTTFVPGSLTCEARGSSVTSSCSYDSMTKKIIWHGTMGSDLGYTTEATANNEVVITFKVLVADTTNQAKNMGVSLTDTNGDGLLTDETTLASVSTTNEVTWNRPTIVIDPKIVKSVSPSQASIGDTVTYSLVITNSGTNPATNVVVTDTVSSYLDIQQVTATKGIASYNGRTATFTIGSVNGGETVTLTIKVKVNSTATVSVEIPNVAVLTHNSYGISDSESSNIVYLRLLGVKTLPNTGEEGPLGTNQNWLLYVLLALIGVGLVIFGLVQLIRNFHQKKPIKNYLLIYGLGISIGLMGLGFLLMGEGVTQITLTKNPSIRVADENSVGRGDIQRDATSEAGGLIIEDESGKSMLLSTGERVVIPAPEPEPEMEMPAYAPISPPANAEGLSGFHNIGGDPDTTAVRQIEIPALGLERNVVFIPFDGRTWPLVGLNQQVAWLGDTSWPGLGSNTVLAGHITLYEGRVGPFYGLEKLKAGDKVIITTDKYTYVYVFSNVVIADQTDAYLTEPTEIPTLTLITCSDWDSATAAYSKRLVVIATLESVISL